MRLDVKDKRILVIVAHQDDETIGCGGTLAKWSSEGANIKVCFMTDGATGFSSNSGLKAKIKEIRFDEANEACKALGIKSVHSLGIPCQEVSNTTRNFHMVIKLIRDFRPEIVISHNKLCKHRDHKQTAEIVREACWKSEEDLLESLGKVHKVKMLLQCEILDPIISPDFIVDITDFYNDKENALEKYKSQEKIIPGINNYINGLSYVRGYSIGAGKRGEAFLISNDIPIVL